MRLTRDDWIAAARRAIADGGLAAVAVEPLAVALGATKGSFYWHFANRDELITAAVEHWEKETTTDVIAELTAAAGTGAADVLRRLIVRTTTLAQADRIGPALLASASHPAVAPVLSRLTSARIGMLTMIFERLGFAGTDARHRALLAYSTYLGYEQLVHSTPDVLPADQHEYLEAAVRLLVSPPAAAG